MSDSSLTGSESQRFEEISKRWLVFEPNSNDFASYGLYSVALGQQHESVLTMDSGSVPVITGSIDIQKDIHRFEDEIEASNFINEIGIENVTSYSERKVTNDFGDESIVILIEVINFPKIDLKFSYKDREVSEGFLIEVFRSGSVEQGGLRPSGREIKKDSKNRIISETYLKYFNIKSDLEDA